LFDASSAIQYAQSIERVITPHHRPGKAGRSPSCVALQQIMPVSISGSGHFGSARACKRRAEEVRSGSSFLNVVPPVPVPGYQCSPLRLERKDYGMCYPPSHRADLCFASRGTTFFHTVHVCKPPYASMECTVGRMQHAPCSCPASTTSSATGSNSRVLTHRLTVCSRSELLHRGKFMLRLTRDENFECRHASSRS
jgi:hypothetical protein